MDLDLADADIYSAFESGWELRFRVAQLEVIVGIWKRSNLEPHNSELLTKFKPIELK